MVASAISDVSNLEEGSTQDISLAGVFSDIDGDALTINAVSSDTGRATVTATVAADGLKLTLTGVAEGTATITVTAPDADGHRASDSFSVTAAAPQEQEPEPEQEPTLTGAAARYDFNGDGKIGRSEYDQAVSDYGGGKITLEEVEEVTQTYYDNLSG